MLDFLISKNSIFLKNKKLIKLEEDIIIDTLSYISPRRKMIDVGACEGYWTVLLSPNFNIIESYEPCPENFKLLKANTSNTKKIKIYNNSLSDKNEEYSMFYFLKDNRYSSGDCIRCENFIHEYSKNLKITEKLAKKILKLNTCLVNSFKYDDLKIDNDDLDFINIDVNGDELRVLNGMVETIKKYKPIVRIVSKKNNDVYDILKKCDYVSLNQELKLFKPKYREILIQ